MSVSSVHLKKCWLVAGMSAMAFWLGSCGYSTRPLYNSAYHTVAVPIFTNKSFRREWEFRLTEAVAKNIEYRTPYKLNSTDKADTVLTGEITDIQENVLTQRAGTILPQETEVTVIVNFTWKDRNGRVLVERKGFNRSATEIMQTGERVTDAEQLAVERLAAAIVDQMQSEW
jgi:Lipopolysaccharide-assembly